jgi:N-carbamoyl-L-amino-acid hydrolase
VKLDDALLANVSEARLWARHVALAAIGATARGGVNRLALTALDGEAQRMLVGWARARGFGCTRDEIGNLHIRRAGLDTAAAPIYTGSHLDTQPTGGKYDGAYGVLAGFEVLEALEDAQRRTRRAIEVVAWTNEEGSRFQPGCMGSSVFAGAAPAQTMLRVEDSAGVSVQTALEQLRALLPLPQWPSAHGRPAAYVEAHIEQGPRLEEAGAAIGVVTGIQGSRRMIVEVLGEEAHAGTTPRAARKDAVLAAVAVISALETLMQDEEDVLRFTVGRMAVSPNSPNTVPSRVTFTIDLRHPDADTLARSGDCIADVAARTAAVKRCRAEVTHLTHVRPTHFPEETIGVVRAAARALGYCSLDMPSGAGHDAMYLARMCPTAMVFVPCLRGISHNETESATPGDLAAGTRVLAQTLVTLADR